jgi:flagellar biosynthesis component FlhA
MSAFAFPSPTKILESLKKGDLAFVAALFGTVVLLVVPVGPAVLDLLLAASIAISLLILLIIVYVKEPEDFSGFPTLLLSVTLYRLALNVASTRLDSGGWSRRKYHSGFRRLCGPGELRGGCGGVFDFGGD